MASIYDRLLLLEKKHLEEGMELSAEQIAKIEHYTVSSQMIMLPKVFR